MASRAPRFLLGYFKWFIVPVGVGLLGYYVVGPRLSQTHPSLMKKIDTLKPIVGAPVGEPTGNLPAGEPAKELKKNLPEPDVQVSVHK